MPRHIVLLTPPTAAHNLGIFLRGMNPNLRVTRAGTRDDLERLCRPDTLLIGFCTPIVVPRRILERLGRPAYNFHPGPPNHPGVRPEAFALHAGDRLFGATAHEMAPRVDTGTIVGVEWFDVPEGQDQRQLGELAFMASVRLFARLAPTLARSDEPLRSADIDWAPYAWTMKDYDLLRSVPAEADRAELDRRIRCTFADPDRPTRIASGSQWFSLQTPPPPSD